VITLTNERQIGPLFRELRRASDLTISQLSQLLHISKSGMMKREAVSKLNTTSLINTACALGYDVALIPARHPGARPTGTGWPA
jgi:hypothetical protein